MEIKKKIIERPCIPEGPSDELVHLKSLVSRTYIPSWLSEAR